MKKYLAFLLSLALMVSSCTFLTMVPVSAVENEASEYEQALSMMKVLGVLEEGVIYSPEDSVCREDLAVYIAKLLKMDEVNNDERYFVDVPSTSYGTWAINKLTDMGIFSIGSDRLFHPANVADMNEVYKVAASILGYDNYAQMHGGYPNGYLHALRSAGVRTEVFGEASLSDVITLLYDVIQAQLYETAAVKDDAEMMAVKGNTILSVYYDMYFAKGTIEAIGRMAMATDKVVAENEILISGSTYLHNADIYEPEFLAQYVKYFYQGKEDEKKSVRLIFPIADKEDIEVNISDLGAISEREIQYYAKNRAKTVNLYGCRWVYNGRPLETKLSETLKGLNKGTIVIRDSDNDKKYDTVVIRDYSNFVVSHIDKSRSVVYNKLKEAGRIDFLDDKLEGVWIYDEKDNKLIFEDIAEGNVLSVAKSKDNTVMNIIVSMTEFNGNLSSKLEKPLSVIVNDNKYEIEPSYEKEFRSLALTVGGMFRYKLDAFGYVAYVYSGESDSVMKYGYITDSLIDGSEVFGDGVLKLKILTLDDKLEEFNLASKTKIDGVLKKDASDMSRAFPGGDSAGNIPNQMIRYALNNDGEIRVVDTLYLNEGYETENNSITSIGKDETKVRWYMNGRLGLTTYIEDANTVVFCRPKVTLTGVEVGVVGYNPTDEEYSVGKPSQHFKSNYYRYTRIYTSNIQNGYADAILYDYEYKELDKNQGYYIDVILVESITESIDKDGEVVKCINGMTGGRNVSYKIPNEVTIGDVDRGDLIQLRFGIRNQVIPGTYPKNEDYTDPGTDIIVLYDYDKYNSGNNGGHPFDWSGNTGDRTIDDEVVEGTATTLYEDKSNSSTEFYRAERQLSFGYVMEKSESRNQIWWSYKPDTGLKNETFRVNNTAIMVYDPSLAEGHQIYSGTIDDIDDAKNVGMDECSRVILHTSIGEAKGLFVFR